MNLAFNENKSPFKVFSNAIIKGTCNKFYKLEYEFVRPIITIFLYYIYDGHYTIDLNKNNVLTTQFSEFTASMHLVIINIFILNKFSINLLHSFLKI